MNVWMLLQIVVNLFFLVGILALWIRLRRPPKDDPRLSRGLQLLQSKISVLEDLSDRTDRQVTQLTKLLENKARQLQTKFIEAEKQTQKLQSSMDRSMEVASIFQDKIPHSEIIERQNTIKHVQAARMAHQGHSVEEIIGKIDLPREQIEFIAKVNKDQLVFDESQLPAWVEDRSVHEQKSSNSPAPAEVTVRNDQDLSLISMDAFEVEPAQEDFESLRKLGEQFKEACKDFEDQQEKDEALSRSIENGLQKVTHQIAASETVKKASHILQSVGESLTQVKDSRVEKVSSDIEIEALDLPEASPEGQEPASSIQADSVKVVPSEPNLNRGHHKTVEQQEVKTVIFPNIDIEDNLS